MVSLARLDDAGVGHVMGEAVPVPIFIAD